MERCARRAVPARPRDRGVFALRAVEAGTTLLSDDAPLAAAVLCELLGSVCSHCFRRSESPLTRCSRCRLIRYCSRVRAGETAIN